MNPTHNALAAWQSYFWTPDIYILLPTWISPQAQHTTNEFMLVVLSSQRNTQTTLGRSIVDSLTVDQVAIAMSALMQAT